MGAAVWEMADGRNGEECKVLLLLGNQVAFSFDKPKWLAYDFGKAILIVP